MDEEATARSLCALALSAVGCLAPEATSDQSSVEEDSDEIEMTSGNDTAEVSKDGEPAEVDRIGMPGGEAHVDEETSRLKMGPRPNGLAEAVSTGAKGQRSKW